MMHFEKDYSLKPHNTFGLAAKAKLYVRIEHLEELEANNPSSAPSPKQMAQDIGVRMREFNELKSICARGIFRCNL